MYMDNFSFDSRFLNMMLSLWKMLTLLLDLDLDT